MTTLRRKRVRTADNWDVQRVGALPSSIEEEQAQLRAALAASAATVACPICDTCWPPDDIERHVNQCIDGPSKKAPAPNDEGKEEKNPAMVQQQWASILPGEKKVVGSRRMPFYKILDGMPISVDAFRYGAIPGCTAYILTHFHSDHYGGLTSKWVHGPIYCTQITARLVEKHLHVDPQWLHPLPWDKSVLLPDTGGVHVTCIPANHCPGAAMIVVEGPHTAHIHPHSTPSPYIGLPRTFRYLHCGDFRACPAQLAHAAMQAPFDVVYLDTTYLDPRYAFPPQPHVVQACVDMLTAPAPEPTLSTWLQKNPVLDAPLVVVGTYLLGKERLIKALAHALQTRIYCSDARKYDTYALLNDPALVECLTRDPREARVHVLSLAGVQKEALLEYTQALQRRGLRITHTMAFRPTGWTYRQTTTLTPQQSLADIMAHFTPLPSYTRTSMQATKDSTPQLRMYAVPYSEHSSFFELMAFMLSLTYRRVVSTVHSGGAQQQKRVQAWLHMWTMAVRAKRAPDIHPRSDEYW
ncbi:DNA cross-link repair protein Pso2/Snm1 [Malassezia pachydermatis]